MAISSSYFYNASTRRIISAFGQIFTGMAITRPKDNGDIYEVVDNIPIEYGAKDKFLNRYYSQRVDDGALETKGYVAFPRMSYQMLSMEYDNNRKTARSFRHMIDRGVDGEAAIIPVKTPYNYNFELKIMALNLTECLQIVEQIIWAFTPTFTISIPDLPFENELADIPFMLTGVQMDDNSNDPPDEGRRVVLFTLNFTGEFWLYGPSGNKREIEVEKRRTGLDTVPAIKPTIEKLVIDVYADEGEFYTGATSGVRYIAVDKNGKVEMDVQSPPKDKRS